MRTLRSRGFTLVELMISVAIIGLLATVALPTFRNFQFRSRQAERAVIVRALVNSLDDYFNREGRYPSGAPPLTFMNGGWNPDASPGTTRKAWRTTGADDWRKLAFEVEGGVYYRYWVYAFVQDGDRVYQIETMGDLDGDLLLDDTMKVYQYSGAVLSKPNFGLPWRCDDCTFQIQLGSPGAF
jgi:prepilin-type N-terminal cleavage/methylation domain-containing protein